MRSWLRNLYSYRNCLETVTTYAFNKIEGIDHRHRLGGTPPKDMVWIACAQVILCKTGLMLPCKLLCSLSGPMV